MWWGKLERAEVVAEWVVRYLLLLLVASMAFALIVSPLGFTPYTELGTNVFWLLVTAGLLVIWREVRELRKYVEAKAAPTYKSRKRRK